MCFLEWKARLGAEVGYGSFTNMKWEWWFRLMFSSGRSRRTTWPPSVGKVRKLPILISLDAFAKSPSVPNRRQ